MRGKLIYLITDGRMDAGNFADKSLQTLKLIEHAVLHRISLIQLREKQLSARLLFELAVRAVRITKNSDTKLLINDRADIALAASADGVHLTTGSLSAATIRAGFPADLMIGVSAHSFETALRAKQDGADFAVLSPIFATPHKGQPLGLNFLRETCEKLKPFPILALGGISAENYREVLETASGLAAIRFLNDEENIRKLTSSPTKPKRL